jgi:hypothetical protein
MRFYGRSWATLVFLSTIWLLPTPAMAKTRVCKAFAAENSLSLDSDLDGDHQSDSASLRYSESAYSIVVRLSSQENRVHLSIPAGYEPGFQLVAYDVDHDRRDDLILIGDSTIVPVAVWLNRGNGFFERKPGSFAPLLGEGAGARLQRGYARSDPPLAISSDSAPDAFEADETKVFHLERVPWRCLIHDCVRQAPELIFSSPRSPPASI